MGQLGNRLGGNPEEAFQSILLLSSGEEKDLSEGRLPV